MKPIRKISDFSELTVLDDNFPLPLIRKFGTLSVWTGGHIDDVKEYHKPPSPINDVVGIKRVDDRLRNHLDSEFPHLLTNIVTTDQEAYKLILESSRGALEVETQASQDSFTYDPTEEYLYFEDMYDKHTLQDLAYHKLYDERDTSWKWYRMNLVTIEEEELFELEYISDTENPEVLGTYEDQYTDFNYYNSELTNHEDSLFPHKIMGIDSNYSLSLDTDEEELIIGVE